MPWALVAGVVLVAAIVRAAPGTGAASGARPDAATESITTGPDDDAADRASGADGVTPAVGSSTVTLAWRPDPTEPPAWVPPTDTPEPEVEPTPSFDECLPFRVEAYDSPGRLGQVIVEIWATNRCGRDLGPLDVWFRVSGIRGGLPERWVDAHPFDAPLRGREVHVTVALPGAVDYYERIEVRPFAPGS